MGYKRKTITVAVTVTCPADMPAAWVRRELRHMTGGYSWDGEDIKIRSVRPLKDPT